jgi:hypothetical protein
MTTTIAPRPWRQAPRRSRSMKHCGQWPRSNTTRDTPCGSRANRHGLPNPDSAEYQALFTAALPGAMLINAVLCHRAIRTLVVDYEARARARSQERLLYRHGVHVITAVMMKRLRNRIGAAAVVETAAITALLSQPDTLDLLRQTNVHLRARAPDL